VRPKRVGGLKVQLAREEEQNGPECGESREASCALFGGLEELVGCFESAVGLMGLGPSDDAFETAR
jgi:hypothetical protein